MREREFIAAHRGGTLTKENHRKLIKWAKECAEHVLSLTDGEIDERLTRALQTAKEWEHGNVAVGAAMKVSVKAHAAARESSDPVSKNIARAVGQAVATAHMADHSIGAALYALKAVKCAGGAVDKERNWQKRKLKELPAEIIELVLKTMVDKEKGFKL